MKTKTFKFTTERINNVKDLKSWCDWLILAGYEDAEVVVNGEYNLSSFQTTEVILK